MLKKFRLLFLIFTIFLKCCPSFILAQSNDFIDGKVINSLTQEPVSFATILLKNNQFVVYTNADGDFKILRSQNFLTDSIVISCIGFKRYSAAYRHFSENTVNTVSLIPITYGLGEEKILASGKKLGSLAIIGKAISNIPKNYPLKPFNYISYYRDYQKRDGKYINLNEAIIQTLDKGFSIGSLFNNYRLLDFRKNVEFPRMNISPYYEKEGYESQDTLKKFIPYATIGDQYGNELFELMTHDAIRNFKSRSFSFLDVFSEDFIRNHNFSEPVAVSNNNLLLFKIIFSGKTRVIGNSLLVTGAVYVEPKSYAIHKIEYSCSYQTGGKGLGEMFSAYIEYGHENAVDSSMYLKYISFNNFLKVTDTDDPYFKVLKAYWEAYLYINPTLVVNFNNKIDPVSGSMKENYELYWGNKPLKITSLQVRDNTVYIRTKEEFIKNKTDSCYIGIHNVRDIDGNVLDKRKRIDLYQFMELFVQEYNKPLVLKDSCNMEYKPIEDNCRSIYNGDEKYWMNTPVNIKISDK